MQTEFYISCVALSQQAHGAFIIMWCQQGDSNKEQMDNWMLYDSQLNPLWLNSLFYPFLVWVRVAGDYIYKMCVLPVYVNLFLFFS